MRRAPALLGAVSAKFAAVVGAAALLAIHLARPDLDPSWHVLSEYSIGRYGWLMGVAFASLALASLSLFVALSGMTKTRSESVGRWLLLGVAAGSAIGGIFGVTSILWTGLASMRSAGGKHHVFEEGSKPDSAGLSVH